MSNILGVCGLYKVGLIFLAPAMLVVFFQYKDDMSVSTNSVATTSWRVNEQIWRWMKQTVSVLWYDNSWEKPKGGSIYFVSQIHIFEPMFTCHHHEECGVEANHGRERVWWGRMLTSWELGNREGGRERLRDWDRQKEIEIDRGETGSREGGQPDGYQESNMWTVVSISKPNHNTNWRRRREDVFKKEDARKEKQVKSTHCGHSLQHGLDGPTVLLFSGLCARYISGDRDSAFE